MLIQLIIIFSQMSLAQSKIVALKKRIQKINEIDIRLQFTHEELQRRRKLFNQEYLIIPSSPNRTLPSTRTNPHLHYNPVNTFTINTDFYKQTVFVQRQSHLLTEHNVNPNQEISQVAQKLIAQQPQKKPEKAVISADRATNPVFKLFPVPHNDENQPANIQVRPPQAEDNTANPSNTSVSGVFGLFSNNLASASGNNPLFGAKVQDYASNETPKQLFLSKSEEKAPQTQSLFGNTQGLLFKKPLEGLFASSTLPPRQSQFVLKQIKKEQPLSTPQNQNRQNFQLGSSSISQKPSVVPLPASIFSSGPCPSYLQTKQPQPNQPKDIQPEAVQQVKPVFTFKSDSPKLFGATLPGAPVSNKPVVNINRNQYIDSPTPQNKAEDGSERIQIKVDEDEDEEEEQNWDEDDKDDEEQDSNEAEDEQEEAEQNNDQQQEEREPSSPSRKPNTTIQQAFKFPISSHTLKLQPPQNDEKKQLSPISEQIQTIKPNQVNISNPTTSLFNANTPKTTLFSAQPSLFNATDKPFLGFGNNKPVLTFGSTTPATNSTPGGLFGTTPANTSVVGGLFSTNTIPANNTTSGGLFNTNNTPANTPAPGLFGISSQKPSLFGQPLAKASDKQFSQAYLQKAATGLFGQTNSLFNPSGSVFSSQTPMFNSPGNLFAGQSSIFSSTPVNAENKDEQEESGEGDDDGPIEAEQNFNPELSTGKYDYIQTNILFKEAINKFRKGKGQVLQNITASLQKFADNPTLYLFIRLANKVIGFSGRFLEKASEIRVLNNSTKNIEIGKILQCGENVANPELCLLRLQFKDEQSGQKFKQQVQKVLKPSGSA